MRYDGFTAVAQGTDPRSSAAADRIVLHNDGEYFILDRVQNRLFGPLSKSEVSRRGVWFAVREGDEIAFSDALEEALQASATERSPQLVTAAPRLRPSARSDYWRRDEPVAELRDGEKLSFQALVDQIDRQALRAVAVDREKPDSVRLLRALDEVDTIRGSVWIVDVDGTAGETDDVVRGFMSRRVETSHERGMRLFGQASLDFALLGGCVTPSDLPEDRFVDRAEAVILSGVRETSRATVADLLGHGGSNPVLLSEPVSGHLWQAGLGKPRLMALHKCILELLSAGQAIDLLLRQAGCLVAAASETLDTSGRDALAALLESDPTTRSLVASVAT